MVNDSRGLARKLIQPEHSKDAFGIGDRGLGAAGQGEVLLHKLLQSGGVRASNEAEDFGDLAHALAFRGEGVGDLGASNLQSLLRRRAPKVVKRLAGLAKGKDDLGFLRALRLFGESWSGLFGNRGFDVSGGLVLSHCRNFR